MKLQAWQAGSEESCPWWNFRVAKKVTTPATEWQWNFWVNKQPEQWPPLPWWRYMVAGRITAAMVEGWLSGRAIGTRTRPASTPSPHTHCCLLQPLPFPMSPQSPPEPQHHCQVPGSAQFPNFPQLLSPQIPHVLYKSPFLFLIKIHLHSEDPIPTQQ